MFSFFLICDLYCYGGEARQGEKGEEGDREKEGRQEARKQFLKKSTLFSMCFIIDNFTVQLRHTVALFGAATLQFPW